MSSWPEIRGVIRDVAAIAIGLYVAYQASQPPITVEDMPAFTVAAGFLGIPWVVRSKDE